MRDWHFFKGCLVLVFISLLSPSLLYGGWILKDGEGTTTFISKGKIKHTEGDETDSYLVIDYNVDRITLVDGSQQIYATGTLAEYCGYMRKITEAFSQMEGAFGDSEENAAEMVEVVAAGQENIAGLKAEKYQVIVDGELYEEVWLTMNSGLMSELGNSASHQQFMECLDAGGDPVESSKAYRELSLKGWELRSISYDFGEKEYNSDTVSIAEENIDDSEFAPPAGFKKLELEEMFMAGTE